MQASLRENTDQLTVTDIACGLGLYKEEKTISRVIQELRRVQGNKI